jgi:hypothetical protein
VLGSAWCNEEERRGKQLGHSGEDRALMKDKDVLAVVRIADAWSRRWHGCAA